MTVISLSSSPPSKGVLQNSAECVQGRESVTLSSRKKREVGKKREVEGKKRKRDQESNTARGRGK